MNHIQITITASEQDQEKLVGQLTELGATGFEQQEERLLAYFEEDHFPSYEVKAILNVFPFEVTTVKEQNWNAVWEKSFEPVVVASFCAVRAHFHQPIQNVVHEIVITPKMSFGTGHHATTYMMMQQMQHLDFKNKTVFDFGTGTGILAILAEKLGAGSVVAIDNDAWSFENATENGVQNGCTRIHFSLSSTLPEQKSFDIVLANINRNVILQYLPHLTKSLTEKSILLLSGLLLDDKKDIVAACQQQGLQLQATLERGNWIALQLGMKGQTNG